MNRKMVTRRFVVGNQYGEVTYDEVRQALEGDLHYMVTEFAKIYFDRIDTDWRDQDSYIEVDVYKPDNNELVGSMRVFLEYTETFTTREIKND